MVVVEDIENQQPGEEVFAAIVQYPDKEGRVRDYQQLSDRLHQQDSFLIVASDIMSLMVLKEPATFQADVAVGSTQRFGVPMGYGGPHAAYFATTQTFTRMIPGRIIGVSVDKHNHQALRMALQTREQHIRRDKATSNICTAQALLAIMASMYAVYHGPKQLKAIALYIHHLTQSLATLLVKHGFNVVHQAFF